MVMAFRGCKPEPPKIPSRNIDGTVFDHYTCSTRFLAHTWTPTFAKLSIDDFESMNRPGF